MNEQKSLKSLAKKHGFSDEAVQHLCQSMRAGGGGMAQFSHPELGGSGQWLSGGMLMISDMFNNALKARVDALCRDLSELVRSSPEAAAPSKAASFASMKSWWPEELGTPSSTGGQNQLRYAYFSDSDRLVVRDSDATRVFDTTGHAIKGFSQQQQNDVQGLHFSSQKGMASVLSLPEVKGRKAGSAKRKGE